MPMKNTVPWLLAGSVALLVACGGAPQNTAQPTAAEAAAQAATATAAAEEAAAALQAAEREAAAAAREAELAQREAELRAREEQLAAAQAAAPAPKPAARPAAKPAPGTAAPVATAPKPEPKPAAPVVVTVPAGTQLSLAMASDVTTKTAKVGDVFRSRVVSDVLVNDRVAIPAGTMVSGSVTQVVSGSSKIGGVPALGIRLERLEFTDGRSVAVSGDYTQSGKSETARDTAKIAGGALAGAVIGHQLGKDGKVIGGLIGAAAGTAAAQKTGGEVSLPADTNLVIALAAPVQLTLR